MLSSRHRRPERAASRAHAIGILGALVGLVLGAVVTALPSGAAPTDVSFAVTVSTQTQDSVGGGDPVVLAEVDNQDPDNPEDELFVTLVLQPPGTTFNKATAVRFTVGGLGTGTFSPATATFPSDAPSATFSGITYNKVESGITLVASSGRGGNLVTGTSAEFDIGYDVVFQGATGDPVTIAPPCTASPSVPLCAAVLLPKGVATRAALALGACTTYYPCSRTDGRVVSFMADVELTYTPEEPATIILRCDKSYCKGGGIRSYELLARPDWSSLTFTAAPACQAKGQAPSVEPYYCVDYVQSHRDNAGDLVLYWLVARDPRGII